MKGTDTVDILAVQQRLIDAGFQYRETVFNDGLPNNCLVVLSHSTDHHYFSRHPMGDMGWGRFHRMTCWRYVAEWLDQWEAGEVSIPCPVLDSPEAV